MDSSHIDTTPVEDLAQTNTTVDQKVDVLEPTNTTVDEKVDPTIPDGDAIETTTTPNSAPSQATTDTTQSCFWSFWKRLVYFYWDNEFLILIISAIALARAYPPLGAEYLASDITASWIAVIFIFILCGLGLKTDEFANALKQFKFNVTVQVFNFGVVSSVVYGVSRALIKLDVVSEGLGNGMVIGASVPMTVNTVIVLIKSSGGDEATAIFNSAFGNMIGVFLSPALILGYLGVSASIDLGNTFMQVALRVVLPVLVGQLLQKFSPTVVAFVKKYKKYFGAAQQYCLVFIVYTVFCETFNNANYSSNIAEIFILIAVQFVLMIFFFTLSWYTFGLLFAKFPKLRVSALHAAVHKTVAMGIPLITAIYGNDPLVGLYTLPLLIWHALQLVLGSLMAPKLAVWVKQEQDRLGLPDAESVVSDEESNASVAPEDQTRIEAITDDVDVVVVEPPRDVDAHHNE